MSSNVGLSTPRGSGTSGYVQRNLSHLPPRDHDRPPTSTTSNSNYQGYGYRDRKPDQEILEHDRKRAVEVKCLEFRDQLEDQGIEDEDELDARVESYRREILAKGHEEGEVGGGGEGVRKGRLKPHQVHEIAAAKLVESERLRNALGISEDYQEGSHWKRQGEERRKVFEERGKGRSASPE